MLTAIIAFVNSHFSGLVAGIAAESSIVSLVYGIVMNDMMFAVALAVVICVLAALGVKLFGITTPTPNCFEIDNVACIK